MGEGVVWCGVGGADSWEELGVVGLGLWMVSMLVGLFIVGLG